MSKSAITEVRQPNGTLYVWAEQYFGYSSAMWANDEGDKLYAFFESAPRFKPFMGEAVKLPHYGEDLEEILEKNAEFLHREGLL